VVYRMGHAMIWNDASGAPRVACLMPTTSARRAFWPLAVTNFAAQSYENAALFVATDGAFAEDGVPRCSCRVSAASTLGDKYNGLHQWAIDDGAEWLALWSDDDWQSSSSIAYRMAAIAPGVRRIGYRSLWFCDLRGDGAMYRFQAEPSSTEQWVAHLSMLIHRSVWLESAGYPDQQVSSDTGFQHRIRKVRSTVVDDAGTMIAIQHQRNTYKQRIDRLRRWHRPDVTLESLMGIIAAEQYRAAAREIA